MNGTAVRDRIFKTVILATLVFSIVIQIVVSAWFFDKLKTLENRLSVYPVNKPVEVDLRITIPELVEIDRKIDKLAHGLEKVLKAPQAFVVSQENTNPELSSKPAPKKAKPRGSNRVDVVEKIGN